MSSQYKDALSKQMMHLYTREMQFLQDELALLSHHEPDDDITMAHVHWEDRLALLEQQIDDVQDRIDELEETMEI